MSAAPLVSQAITTASPFDDAEDARRLITAVSRNVMEILLGQRPMTSLDSVLDMEVRNRLLQRSRLIAQAARARGVTRLGRITVGGVNICRVSSTVVEASSVVTDSRRARFLVMRWELRHSGWRVVVLEIG